MSNQTPQMADEDPKSMKLSHKPSLKYPKLCGAIAMNPERKEEVMNDEELVRAYYIRFGICPPACPYGLAYPIGAYHDVKLPSSWSIHLTEETTYWFSKRSNRWLPVKASKAAKRRVERKERYDSAIYDGDRDSIHTTWIGEDEGEIIEPDPAKWHMDRVETPDSEGSRSPFDKNGVERHVDTTIDSHALSSTGRQIGAIDTGSVRSRLNATAGTPRLGRLSETPTSSQQSTPSKEKMSSGSFISDNSSRGPQTGALSNVEAPMGFGLNQQSTTNAHGPGLYAGGHPFYSQPSPSSQPILAPRSPLVLGNSLQRTNSQRLGRNAATGFQQDRRGVDITGGAQRPQEIHNSSTSKPHRPESTSSSSRGHPTSRSQHLGPGAPEQIIYTPMQRQSTPMEARPTASGISASAFHASYPDAPVAPIGQSSSPGASKKPGNMIKESTDGFLSRMSMRWLNIDSADIEQRRAERRNKSRETRERDAEDEQEDPFTLFSHASKKRGRRNGDGHGDGGASGAGAAN